MLTTQDASMERVIKSMKDRHAKRYYGVTDAPMTDASALLACEVADILTGPTSGGNAEYLAVCLCGTDERAKETARAMVEAGTAYLNSIKPAKRARGKT